MQDEKVYFYATRGPDESLEGQARRPVVGIPTEVIDAVTAVTKRPGEPTEDYAARVRASALGLQVKEADLADNCDPARMALLDENTRERLTSKYRRLRALLHPESAPHTS